MWHHDVSSNLAVRHFSLTQIDPNMMKSKNNNSSLENIVMLICYQFYVEFSVCLGTLQS